MIKYDKLWETAEKRGITKSMLTKKYNVSKAQLYRLRYNQPVSTNTLDRLCNILECDISDIMEHIPDNNFFQTVNCLLIIMDGRISVFGLSALIAIRQNRLST